MVQGRRRVVPFEWRGTRGGNRTRRRLYNFSVLSGLVRTFSWALAFAGLLQGSSAAAGQATTPEGQSSAAPGQEMKQGVEGDLATIVKSRSTNTRGYELVIHNDGSVTAEISGATVALRSDPPRSQQFPAGTIDTKILRRLLAEIGDVSKIPTGGCAKSVSFGTRTQITYAGKTSGDLQCIRHTASDGDQAPQQASEDLSKFVQTTLGQLKINDRRISANR
jgi:hypothetical protein